jgi:hypothetical protein
MRRDPTFYGDEVREKIPHAVAETYGMSNAADVAAYRAGVVSDSARCAARIRKY